MNELFNFHDSWILVGHNWFWLALAFALGIYAGYTTCQSDRSSN